MVFKKREENRKGDSSVPSNVSPKSLDVLKMKVDHHLNKKKLQIPQVVSWENLKKANPWLGPVEDDVKKLFNVRSIPRLDRYAQKLVDQHEEK